MPAKLHIDGVPGAARPRKRFARRDPNLDGLFIPRPRLKGRLAPFTKKEERRARFLYVRQRLSSYQVAEILGRHPTGVRKALRRIGVRLRSMSEAAMIEECQGVPTFRTHKLVRR